jgi:hypothetical protein
MLKQNTHPLRVFPPRSCSLGLSATAALGVGHYIGSAADTMKTGVADISACAKREVLPLLDHLVGASMQGRRNGEAKRFGSLEIDDNSNVVGCSTGNSGQR